MSPVLAPSRMSSRPVVTTWRTISGVMSGGGEGSAPGAGGVAQAAEARAISSSTRRAGSGSFSA